MIIIRVKRVYESKKMRDEPPLRVYTSMNWWRFPRRHTWMVEDLLRLFMVATVTVWARSLAAHWQQLLWRCGRAPCGKTGGRG